MTAEFWDSVAALLYAAASLKPTAVLIVRSQGADEGCLHAGQMLENLADVPPEYETPSCTSVGVGLDCHHRHGADKCQVCRVFGPPTAMEPRTP